MLAVLYAVRRFYLRTSRRLRLLDLEAKSPLQYANSPVSQVCIVGFANPHPFFISSTHYLDTIKGAATLRAFDWIKDSVALNNNLLNTSQRPAYLLSLIQRWLSFVLDMVVTVLALLVLALIPASHQPQLYQGKSFSHHELGQDSGEAGTDVYGPRDVDFGARYPQQITLRRNRPRGSVRCVATAETLDKYENLVLRDLTFTIEAGQKVAICGRTGSGKTSVILLLLRLLDPVPSTCTENGNLMIDDVSLRTIDDGALRRRIIAVPQDATFFPDGTSFRTNLDPFAEIADTEYQAVPKRTALWPLVSARGGLRAALTADVLSHVQRQLWSLARAVRRHVCVKQQAAEVGVHIMLTQSRRRIAPLLLA